MPPRKTKRRGRQLVEELNDTGAPAASAEGETGSAPPVSAEYLNAVFSELDKDVDMRCKRLKMEVDDARSQLLQEFKIMLFVVPKRIREMPLKQFRDEFGGCVSEVLKKTVAAEMEKLPPRTTLKIAAQSSASSVSHTPMPTAMPTPAPRSTRASARKPPLTDANFTPASRQPRGAKPGETCFSVKGSPLKSSAFTAPTTVRATVKANRSGSSASLSESAIKASTISIELPAATGGIVDVSDAESLKQALEGDATGEMKADAHAKLKSLQDEVAAMLQTIGGA